MEWIIAGDEAHIKDILQVKIFAEAFKTSVKVTVNAYLSNPVCILKWTHLYHLHKPKLFTFK